ncbi:MAG: bifunctional adenosylcobinamide kinase/adenosylcobinamide-phosphate guanylyltransferase [Clostridiales bacterium]|nr:bifunctional adenosylcobinamide kinase/adenosylcobinamide-phosphate guanylyltransferase [Clostridiales bacterium]
MILITGGAYQGKKDFAEKLRKQKYQAGETDAEVLADIHEIIAEELREGRDPWIVIEDRVQKQPGVIVTVNELGCGIVPMDPFDREWREVTGRISCKLAEQAEEVYRVTCGIAVRIK